MARSFIIGKTGLIILLLSFCLSAQKKPIAVKNQNDNNLGIITDSQCTQLFTMILQIVNNSKNMDKVIVDTLDQLDTKVICYDKIAGNVAGNIIRINYKDRDSTFKVSKIESYLNSNFQFINNCMADGPDGTSQVYVKNRAMLILDGKWDGGDDFDTTYVPSKDYEFTFYILKTNKADSVLMQIFKR